MRGDAQTLAAKAQYVTNCESYRLTFHRQAISVELSTMHEQLVAGRIKFKRAHQGIEVLSAIRHFLDEVREVRAEGKAKVISERNLRQCSTEVLDALMKLLRRIKLPFELLVPDMEYEEVKGSLMKLMEKELERRQRLEKAAAEKAAAGSKVEAIDMGASLCTVKKETQCSDA